MYRIKPEKIQQVLLENLKLKFVQKKQKIM